MQKVLIVDDSQTNLALLEHMLLREGCEIVSAESGQQAIELVAEHDFALILLDIQMPEMNGYETANRIKLLERGKHVPIIFITAIFQDEENVRQGYQTGAVDYLFRPVDVEMLKSKVQVFLQMNAQKQRLEQEIEERKKQDATVSLSELKYRAMFERSVEGLFRASVEGTFLEVNPAMVQILGYDSVEEVINVEGMRQRIMPNIHDQQTYLETLRRDGFVANFEFLAKRKDDETIWCSESSRLVGAEDGKEYIEGVLEDVTARKQQEMDLKHLATIDSLTEIPNRHLFFDRSERALKQAKRYEKKVAVLFIDLDNFKLVNDTYGHRTGDELLREVAARLIRRIRESDTLARLGGDEFGVLLPEIETEEAAKVVARSLLEELDRPFMIDGESVNVGATIGISFFPEDGKDCVSLISRADSAMYGAKRKTGIRYGTFREFGIPK